MTVPVKQSTNPQPQTMEDVITKGDLSKLTPDQRTEYYIKVCDRHGLDPLTQPFDWLTLNGRLTLYANRRCADQLRKINGIHINIVSQETADGLLTIHVKAKDNTGREDEDLGVINFPDTLKGDARANAILKCVTKAKRRVTLSISGLGFLDETEVEDIPKAAKGPPVDPETGEVLEPKLVEPTKITESTPFAKPSLLSQAIQEGATYGGMKPPTKAAEALTSIAKHSTDGPPHEIILTDPVDWIWFGQLMIGYAKMAEWFEWRDANTVSIARMQNEAPKVFDRMKAAINKIGATQQEPRAAL